MKQQLLEQRIRNALAAARQAKAIRERGDDKHADDYLNRVIDLLEEN